MCSIYFTATIPLILTISSKVNYFCLPISLPNTKAYFGLRQGEFSWEFQPYYLPFFPAFFFFTLFLFLSVIILHTLVGCDPYSVHLSWTRQREDGTNWKVFSIAPMVILEICIRHITVQQYLHIIIV